jgi:hypothetical protein
MGGGASLWRARWPSSTASRRRVAAGSLAQVMTGVGNGGLMALCNPSDQCDQRRSPKPRSRGRVNLLYRRLKAGGWRT